MKIEKIMLWGARIVFPITSLVLAILAVAGLAKWEVLTTVGGQPQWFAATGIISWSLGVVCTLYLSVKFWSWKR